MPSHRRIVSIPFLVLSVLIALSVTTLGEDDERDRVKAFKEAMKSREESDRLKAVVEFGAQPGKSIGKELRKVVSGDRSDRVRAVAARAIGERGDRKDLPFLLSSLRSLKKHPVALAGAIDAIGLYGEPKTAEAIYDAGRLWLRKHKYPAMASIRALGRIRSGEAIELLFKMYDLTYPRAGYGPGGESGNIDGSVPTGSGLTSDDTEAALSDFRPHIVAALQGLTGEPIVDVDDWRDWWRGAEDDFDPSAVKVDPNRQLKLIDSEFSFEIRRPGSEWKWTERPRDGFSRSADLTEDGKITAHLDILVYSTALRGPKDPKALAAEEKERLKKKFTRLTEEKFDEAVKVDGVDGIRHTVAGQIGLETAGCRITFVLLREKMYVLSFRLEDAATRGTLKSVREFEGSFGFLR